MTRQNLITVTEQFVRKTMSQHNGDLLLTHDYCHVDRVRNWALKIAHGEKYVRTDRVELAALLHDIGLSHMHENSPRKERGAVGAPLAAEFLKANSKLSDEDIELICDAIKYHCLSPKITLPHLQKLGENGKLLQILRDADNLDVFGAVGLMRTFASKYNIPPYDPQNIRGTSWEIPPAEFQAKYGFDPREKFAPVHYAIDQINQNARYSENMHTQTGKKLAVPLLKFTKEFLLQLEREVKGETE